MLELASSSLRVLEHVVNYRPQVLEWVNESLDSNDG